MLQIRNIIPLFLLVLLSCNDSKSYSSEDSVQKKLEDEQDIDPWITPRYYTDFDISSVDSVIVSWDSKRYKEFGPPYSVKIADKKANSIGELWSFTIEDSLCTCNSYYFVLRNNSDSAIYSFSVSSQDTGVYLNGKQSVAEFPYD